MTSPAGTRIRKLPREVVDRIAAGEVVERPASVVKELVENALDAGATHVDVEIRGGGRDLIAVRDDGVGMGPEDLALAFESHATSKLADVSDLEHIASFGFRGEALASIAAVADCRILTQERGAAHGHEAACQGGVTSPVRIAAAPPGTVVEVRQLFKYVPARRKFLRAQATEAAHAAGAVHAAALAHPDVGFSLTREGAVLFRVGPGEPRRERIAQFFGRQLAEALVPVAARDGTLHLEGFVARPDAARPSASWQHFFLNGRPIRDRTLAHALRQGYEGLLTRERFPVAFLFLAIDPAEVDVNVHPAKLEVRFRDAERVHRLVEHAVRDALLPAIAGGVSVIPTRAVAMTATSSPARDHAEGVAEALSDYLTRPHPAEPPRPPQRATAGVTPTPRPSGRYLQVRDLFLVFEVDDGLAIVDQHALHERVLLEQLEERVAAGTLEVQRLLVPAIVEFPATDVDLLLAEGDALATVGLHVERFGPTSVAVQSLPALLAHREPARILGGVVERLRGGGGAGGKAALLESLLHSMACRSAVMAGDSLSEVEITELMRRADLLDNRHGCAHGRPTALRVPFRDLERHFRR